MNAITRHPERGSMKSLAAWVKQSDQVMVF